MVGLFPVPSVRSCHRKCLAHKRRASFLMRPHFVAPAPMSVPSKFPSPPFFATSADAWRKVTNLRDRLFPRPSVSLPASQHLPSRKTGSIDLAHASCPFSCPSSSAAIGFPTRPIPSAAGRRPVPCRPSLPGSEDGGMCAPLKGRINRDDQSRDRKSVV